MFRTIVVTLALAGTLSIGTAHAQTPSPKKPIDIIKLVEEGTVRRASIDICWPASDTEYEALGKFAVVKLTASSVLSSELPLKAAYLTSKGVKVPLQRLAVFDKRATPGETSNKTYFEQVSFYLVPIYLMKKDAELSVDFSGQRDGFEVMTFSAKKGLDPGVPAFVRLDEYDSPTDPDMGAVAALLSREYPEYFSPAGAN